MRCKAGPNFLTVMMSEVVWIPVAPMAFSHAPSLIAKNAFCGGANRLSYIATSLNLVILSIA